MSGEIAPALLETVARRSSVIETLLEARADKRELEEALDVSRTTIDRAIDRLGDAGCVCYHDGTWGVTLLGRLAYEEYDRLSERYRSLVAARSLLDQFPSETAIDMRLLTGAEVSVAEPPAPHTPLAELESLLDGCEHVRGLSSVVLPKYISLLYESTVENGVDTTVVFDADLVEYLRTHHAETVSDVLEAEGGAIWQCDQRPPFSFTVVDERVVWFAVYDEAGGLRGSIANDSPGAVAWATEAFRSYRQRAEPVLPSGESSTPVSENCSD